MVGNCASRWILGSLRAYNGRRGCKQQLHCPFQNTVRGTNPPCPVRALPPRTQFNVHGQPNSLVTATSLQVAAIAAMCVQSEADYRPLTTDVVQSLIPLVKQHNGSRVTISPKFRHHIVTIKSSSIGSGSSGTSLNSSRIMA
jgi:hypothetical protein